MQNEELTKELNALQEKFNKEIEDVKKKHEVKPMFEVGKWYKKRNLIVYVTDIKENGNACNGYGLNYNDEWLNLNNYEWGIQDCVLANPEEVEKALTKEAVKRYEGVKKVVSARYKWDATFIDKGSTKFDEYGFMYKGCYVFYNSEWATPIKEKTLDEIVRDLECFSCNVKEYLTANKKEIINALNK